MVDNEVPRRTEPQADGCVVVGCDGSWESLEAVDVAAREARWRGQELVVVTLEEGMGRGAHGPRDWAGSAREVAEEVRSAGARALERLRTTDVPARTVTAATAASPALEPLAQRASVLVLGRHGARGVGIFTMGSPSEALARRLGVPGDGGGADRSAGGADELRGHGRAAREAQRREGCCPRASPPRRRRGGRLLTLGGRGARCRRRPGADPRLAADRRALRRAGGRRAARRGLRDLGPPRRPAAGAAGPRPLTRTGRGRPRRPGAGAACPTAVLATCSS